MFEALMVYDWTITSGGAAKQIQKLINGKYDGSVTVDGGMGEETVGALNEVSDQDALLQDIAEIRRQYYANLTVNDPTQLENLKDWLNRVNDCLDVEI